MFFADAGISVRAVMTDNGACYRSHDFANALGDDVKHRRTRPYRPQTNGKVERFNRTLAAEWAYAEVYLSDNARAATYADWLHYYNHHRPHTGISVQYLSEVERGRKEPSSEILGAVSGALGLRLVDLTRRVSRSLSSRPSGPLALAA